MPVAPRVLLSIDYEPVFALFRHYDRITDGSARREIDGGFTLQALDSILDQLGDVSASFYLVGEIATWYPQVPARIVSAGHELGLHCQFHRPLLNVDQLADDLRASADWCRQYEVRGYRAPMIGIREESYPLLETFSFQYSSSIYAPTGALIRKGRVWELPVSTISLWGSAGSYAAPRDFSPSLLLHGEFPYGSSFSLGLLGRAALKIIEAQLRAGRSPVIIFHPYELVDPGRSRRLTLDLLRNPLFVPFLRNKSALLAALLRNFPVSSLGSYLNESLLLAESK